MYHIIPKLTALYTRYYFLKQGKRNPTTTDKNNMSWNFTGGKLVETQKRTNISGETLGERRNSYVLRMAMASARGVYPLSKTGSEALARVPLYLNIHQKFRRPLVERCYPSYPFYGGLIWDKLKSASHAARDNKIADEQGGHSREKSRAGAPHETSHRTSPGFRGIFGGVSGLPCME